MTVTKWPHAIAIHIHITSIVHCDHSNMKKVTLWTWNVFCCCLTTLKGHLPSRQYIFDECSQAHEYSLIPRLQFRTFEKFLRIYAFFGAQKKKRQIIAQHWAQTCDAQSQILLLRPLHPHSSQCSCKSWEYLMIVDGNSNNNKNLINIFPLLDLNLQAFLLQLYTTGPLEAEADPYAHLPSPSTTTSK